MPHTVLIVEDDRKIATMVAKNLEAAGLACAHAASGEVALAEFARVAPALVLLDLGLPDIDGVDIARRIRAQSDIPILMLTARASDAEKVLGLEIGADDYLTKPFSTTELVARVRALLRRAGGVSRERVLVQGGLRIDPARREVDRAGTRVPMTALEFDLLYFLASRPGQVFSREQLMRHVWGDDRIVTDRSIDSLVSRLRKKLEVDPDQPAYLVTVWGAGYRFEDAP